MPLDGAGPLITTAITSYDLNGMRVARSRDGVVTWFHADHLSSATRLTDETGLEVRRLAYTAFGEHADNQGTGDDPKYTYTSKELDTTGLYYYGARYYDPALCRFITADTVYDAGPQGLNRYSYALNNPILYRDPTGQYVDADLDECTYGDCAYDDGPVAKGNITGSQEQIADDNTAIVRGNGDQSVAYWHGFYGYPHQGMSDETARTIVNTTLTVMDVGVAIACETYDWGSTIFRWTQGDFSYWDIVGFFPIVSGTGTRKIGALGDVITNFFTKNRVAAYAFARGSEFISNFTPKTWRYEASVYAKYLQADTILLGRFYQEHLGRLDDFGQGLVPHVAVLSGNIGYGKHMVRNIQRVIDQTNHIYIRTEGVYKGLDKLSFTYRHELGYIPKNKQLIDKTVTLAEDGSELLLEIWAKMKGLRF